MAFLHLCASVFGVLLIAIIYVQLTIGSILACRRISGPMKKLGLTLLLVFTLGLVIFSTWQLYAGNLTASFSTLPFLLITYLFVIRLRR